MQPAQMFGKEYLTYVLWAITPEGKPSNLGEVLLDGTKSKLTVDHELAVVWHDRHCRALFRGKHAERRGGARKRGSCRHRGNLPSQSPRITNSLQRGQYTYDISKAREPITDFSPKVPLEVYEARNAVSIAAGVGRGNACAGCLSESARVLEQCRCLAQSQGQRKEVIAAARDAVQTAADARTIALKRAADQKAAAERAAQEAATEAANASQKARRSRAPAS